MKIWCTDKEKNQMIKILSKDDALCVFSNMICFREDCEKCLNENIDWHVTKEKRWQKNERIR